MQDEREPFSRRQCVEDNQECEANRVGEQRLILGAVLRLQRDDRLRQLPADIVLAAGAAGAQHVEGDPGDDGGEPAAHVLHLACFGAVEAEPALLHGVLGFAQRAEHPVGDCPQVGAVLLELSRLPVCVLHRHILPFRFVMGETKHDGPM